MLTQVLQEIANAREPISVPALSLKLGIEQSALEGMLAHWVRKGRLAPSDADSDASVACATGQCSSACGGRNGCPFASKMPKSYSRRP